MVMLRFFQNSALVSLCFTEARAQTFSASTSHGDSSRFFLSGSLYWRRAQFHQAKSIHRPRKPRSNMGKSFGKRPAKIRGATKRRTKSFTRLKHVWRRQKTRSDNAHVIAQSHFRSRIFNIDRSPGSDHMR